MSSPGFKAKARRFNTQNIILLIREAQQRYASFSPSDKHTSSADDFNDDRSKILV